MNVTYFETFLRIARQLKKRRERLARELKKRGATSADPMWWRQLEGDLGGPDLFVPPITDSYYECTPANAVTFATMCVDGVHYAILEIDGGLRDDSPVIQVSPMDSDTYIVLADSFLTYLADACGVSTRKMKSLFVAERTGKRVLAGFLRRHFDGLKLFKESRLRKFRKYQKFVERKPGWG